MRLMPESGVLQEERDGVAAVSLSDWDAPYACGLGRKIIPLDIELRRPLDIWRSYHPGSGHILRVRRMIDCR
jgi:hypothetical protein